MSPEVIAIVVYCVAGAVVIGVSPVFARDLQVDPHTLRVSLFQAFIAFPVIVAAVAAVILLLAAAAS